MSTNEGGEVGSSRPRVSVVMPTYNRRAQLERALDALARQSFPREHLEVVVVSDGSTDGTDAFLWTSPPLPIVVGSQANGGPAAARNHGVELASAPLVLFVDDDVVAAPDLVERHVESHAQGGDRLVVIGPMLTPADLELTPWVQWEQTMLYRQYEAMERGEYEATARQFYTGNASVARDAVIEVGGFDTSFRRAEDLELAYRLEGAGFRFEFNHDAIGYHYADRPFDSWLRNGYDYGVNDVVFARDHGRRSVARIMGQGFRGRSSVVRRAELACIEQPALESGLESAFRAVFSVSRRLRSPWLAQRTLSGLYNLAYYRGVADELGGPDEFRRAMATWGNGA